ncbi:hypothetical protein FQR65_LT14551 [Abscondita terminalis]|nr:hypothetical protein FQR65_LT14551 [Abscondita terminalis]
MQLILVKRVKTISSNLAEMLSQLKLLKKLRTVNSYSILVDETTDVSITEQMSFCIRFCDTESHTLREDFISFIEISDMSGKSLSDVIINKLSTLGLSLSNLRGQGYDGAANMSGCFNGVQSHILSLQSKALYTHCSSHCLNLAICKASSVTSIKNAIGVIQSVTTFCRESPKRIELFEEKICMTKWIEKHEALLEFYELLPVVIAFLEDVTSDSKLSPSITSKADSYCSSVLKSDFIISLM